MGGSSLLRRPQLRTYEGRSPRGRLMRSQGGPNRQAPTPPAPPKTPNAKRKPPKPKPQPKTKQQTLVKESLKALLPACKDCYVKLVKMDFEEWFRTRREPNMMETHSEDTDGRLGKQENGMVLLPRTFYKKHPVKAVSAAVGNNLGQRRQSSRLSSSDYTPKKKYEKKKPVVKVVKEQEEEVEEEDGDDDAVSEFEYRLVLDSSSRVVETPPLIDFSLRNLCEMVDSDRLPSSMWEIERIPPMLNKSDNNYDSIAAELEALMGESKEEDEKTEEVVESAAKSEVVEEEKMETEETPTEIESDAAEVPKSEQEKVHDEYPSIMDILNELPTTTVSKEPDNENNEVPQDEQIKETTIQEEVSVDSVVQIASESIENVVESMEIDDTAAVVEDPKPESESNTVEEDTTKDEIVEPTPEETKDEPPIDTKVEEDQTTTTTSTTMPECKDKFCDDGEYTLKSVIFRRFTPDKQTYDRLVTFQENMEYFVAINDKKVELLGAPGFITSIDDLQILLQIVDDVNLSSFNVLLKS